MDKNNFSKITKFTDLIAWQEAHKLVLMIYQLTKEFPKEEKYCLVDQLRRAVISITSCIAEGFTRRFPKEKIYFYKTAQGSLTEIQNQLLISKDVGYLNKETFSKVANQTVTVHKLLNGLIKSTKIKEYEKSKKF